MVEITFDRPRHLKFDMAAIRDLENAFNGEPLGAIVNKLTQLGVNAIETALWAGLKHEDRALTLTLVHKYFQTYIDKGGSVTVLATGLNDALQESGLFGRPEESDAAPKNDDPSAP